MPGWIKTVGLVAGIVVAVLVAGLMGYGLRGCTQALRPVEAEATQEGTEEEEEILFWTCSMHPTINEPEPGLCRICNMELIPVREGEGDAGPRQFATSEAGRALMNIQTSPVQRKFVTREVRMVGTVTYDETLLRHIAARMPGRLDRLYVDYTGMTVRKGDHMAEIYSPELLSAQEELLQALQAVEDLGASDISVVRNTARATVAAARDKLLLLGIKPDQIREIEERGTPTDHVTLYAPMGGTIVHKNAHEGMYVQTGARVYTIADLSRVWVLMDAYESDLEWLRFGQTAEFTAEAYPGETFTERIAFIDPVLDPKTRTVKVRVNVENAERKLKPEMFVRAVVRAKVAGGGRVMEPDLVGMWICPMHPEVIKPRDGQCDICGMDLITTAEAGYVAVDEEATAAPLVIPASAALVTGTRAIVYVEITEAEKPTFEGREIVLGPRAGDYYIVRHGLEEGQIVVTEGNFKIDAALQIKAKPSMMTPGGGAAMAHRHEPPEGGEEQAEAAERPELPQAFRRQLQSVQNSYAKTERVLAADDFDAVKGAFRELGRAVDAVRTTGLSRHQSTMWQDLAMLLGNDAFEGSEALRREDVQPVMTPLRRHMARLRKTFGLDQVAVAPPAQPGREPQPPAVSRDDLQRLFEIYQELHSALAGDDVEAARDAVVNMAQAVSAAGGPEPAEALSGIEDTLGALPEDPELAAMRDAFIPISIAMTRAIERVGLPGAGAVYELHCPMAAGGQGADWLQVTRETRNPFFGSQMLGCGDVVRTLQQGNGGAGADHE